MTNILQMFDTVASSENGAWLHLNVPSTEEKAYADGDKKKKPLRIKLKGPDSDIWTSFQRKIMKNGNKEKAHEDEILDDAKLLAKMTLAFENIPDTEFSLENAIKLYLNYKDIRLQVLRFVMSQSNFTQKLSED